jgi:hypothetical protein
MRNVQTEFVHVNLNITVIHILNVDLSVLITTNVLEIKLVQEINVLIHVLEHAVKMQIVKSSIIFQHVRARSEWKEMLLLVVRRYQRDPRILKIHVYHRLVDQIHIAEM